MACANMTLGQIFGCESALQHLQALGHSDLQYDRVRCHSAQGTQI
jgi:hypothetical protein